MTRDEIINIMSKNIKLVRVESNYTQDKMAHVLGISKKTLVQIEKDRIKANWPTIVTFCALFKNSETIKNIIGEEHLEILQVIAHERYKTPKQRTMGGKVWWNEVDRSGTFYLQKNIISGHYRILDSNDYRWLSTFDKEEAFTAMEELHKTYD